MKITTFTLVLCTIFFMTSCGGGSTESTEKETVKTEQPVDVDAMIKSYCDCITGSEVTDSCATMMIDHTMAIVTDKTASAKYNAAAEECTMKRQAQDEKKALDAIDNMMKE